MIIRESMHGVIPLEIWDCELTDGTLWDHMHDEQFPESLRETVYRLTAGNAVSQSKGPLLSIPQDFDAIYIGGGGATDVNLEPLGRRGIPIVVAPDPLFAMEAGGQELLNKYNISGPIIDIGQSQIKLSFQSVRATVPRKMEQFPMANTIANEHLPNYAAALAGVIEQGVSSHCGDSDLLTGMILALPCEISDDCILAPCSYPGINADSKFLDYLVQQMSFHEQTIVLINDAELVAISACLDLRLPHKGRTLVLTLGFGVGAAILDTTL